MRRARAVLVTLASAFPWLAGTILCWSGPKFGERTLLAMVGGGVWFAVGFLADLREELRGLRRDLVEEAPAGAPRPEVLQ